MRKRVDDGKIINIWKDKWIPGREDGLIRSHQRRESSVQKVAELLIEEK